MKIIITVCLVLTAFGAMNSLLAETIGNDLIEMTMGQKRTVGTDILKLLTGFSAFVIVIWGLRKLYSEPA